MEQPHILIVEDNPSIAALIEYALGCQGQTYSISFAYDGTQALEIIQEVQPDLILLDIHLPGANGHQVARRLRSAGDTTPIIILTAEISEKAYIKGFRSGCDDYLTKPFKPTTLAIHVEAQLERRRHQPGSNTFPVLRFQDLAMDIRAHEARRGSRILDLTAREYQVLEYFLRHPQQALKRDLLRERIWGLDSTETSNIVDVYVRYLRLKLESHGESRLLHTVRSVGYILREPEIDFRKE